MSGITRRGSPYRGVRFALWRDCPRDAGSIVPVPQSSTRRIRVLVVDDNRDLVETTVALLRLADYEAKPCYHGDEVMDCVRAFDPHAIIMDIGLPGRTGWQLAEEIRTAIPGERPLLVGISGEFAKGVNKEPARMRGFDYFLAKPADPNVLMALIERATKT